MRPQATIDESDTRAVGEPDVGARRWAVLWRELRRPHRLIRGLVAQVAGDGVSTLAAALSYYFFFSLFPFLLFLLALVTLLPGVDGLEDWLLGRAAEFVPASAYASLEGVIRGLLGQPRSGLLSWARRSRCGARRRPSRGSRPRSTSRTACASGARGGECGSWRSR